MEERAIDLRREVLPGMDCERRLRSVSTEPELLIDSSDASAVVSAAIAEGARSDREARELLEDDAWLGAGDARNWGVLERDLDLARGAAED